MNTTTKGFIIIKDNGQVEKITKDISLDKRSSEYNKDIDYSDLCKLLNVKDFMNIKCKNFTLDKLVEKFNGLSTSWDSETEVSVVYSTSLGKRPNIITRYLTNINFITGDVIIIPAQSLHHSKSIELFNETKTDHIYDYLNIISYEPYFINREKDCCLEYEVINRYSSIEWLINLFCSWRYGKSKQKDLLPVNENASEPFSSIEDNYTKIKINDSQKIILRTINDNANELYFLIYDDYAQIYNKDIPKIFVQVFKIVAEYFIYIRETISDPYSKNSDQYNNLVQYFFDLQYHYQTLFNIINKSITRYTIKLNSLHKNRKPNYYYYDNIINEFIVGASKHVKICKKEISEYVVSLYFK